MPSVRRVRFFTARSLLRAGLAIGAVAALSACASIRDHRGYFADPGMIESVLPGVDNQESVEKGLGRPTFVSQFGQPAWYYVSINTAQKPFARPKTENQAVTRILFDAKGNVARVDTRGAEAVAALDPDGHKTPTLGRDRTFLQDLFGNIGAVGAGGAGGGGDGGGGPNG